MFRRNKNRPKTNTRVPNIVLEQNKNETISSQLADNIKRINELVGENDDLVSRHFEALGQYPAAIFYFSAMSQQDTINIEILKPLMYGSPQHDNSDQMSPEQLKNTLFNRVLYHMEGKMESSLLRIVEALFRGDTIALIDGLDEAFVIGTRNIQKRAIANPENEQAIRGPREGFIESIDTNISLLRYRLQTPNFRVKTMNLGQLTKSKVAFCYIEGLTNPELISEVKRRLHAIDLDGLLDAGYIEQYIEDNHFSPFPQIQYTERPDKIVASLLEGRIAIFVDGSPFGLIVPAVFNQFYQTTEDYAERFVIASLVRLIRLLALTFSLVASSLYVAVISFNPELIPTDFAVAVAGARAGVPFPAVLEVLFIEIAMEVLREATLRLPQQIGGALSIVGILVVGQAAVEAGFVSPITVVIVAITTISSFAAPAYNAAIAFRMLRFPVIILSGLFGLYGIVIGLIIVVNHMLSLRSFGVPYLTPVVPWQLERSERYDHPRSTLVDEKTTSQFAYAK